MSGETEGLGHVYDVDGSDSAQNAYNDWAASYDADNVGKGYRIPWLAAAFFARHVPLGSGPILDAGCGTGLVGEALSILGYDNVVGVDLSPEMLKLASSSGVYERHYMHDLAEPLPETDDYFAAVACIGSLGPGHAPASCLAEFIRVTRPGGKVILNVRHDTYEEQGLKAVVESHKTSKQWMQVEASPVFRPFLLAEPNVTAQLQVYAVL